MENLLTHRQRKAADAASAASEELSFSSSSSSGSSTNMMHKLLHGLRNSRWGKLCPKEFSYRGKNMFLSTHVPALANRKVDWLDGRNLCREYCMDLVALETQEKNNLIFRVIQQNDVPYIWTAGRICDFAGCENRPDLEPKHVYGWFWSATREKIQATNRIPQGWGYNPWSQTGHKKRPQPDNAEYDINQTKEQCLSVLNNVYNDGIAWHDVACYHEKPVICEDNEELLRYVAATNPGIRL